MAAADIYFQVRADGVFVQSIARSESWKGGNVDISVIFVVRYVCLSLDSRFETADKGGEIKILSYPVRHVSLAEVHLISLDVFFPGGMISYRRDERHC